MSPRSIRSAGSGPARSEVGAPGPRPARKHLNIRIQGRVQGVCFRAAALEKALEMGITGFARNQRDGAVYIEAEGEERSMDEFLKWCRRGPPMAIVSNVNVEAGPTKNFANFNITFEA